MSHTNRTETNTNATHHGHAEHAEKAEHAKHAEQELSTATAPREQKAFEAMLPSAKAIAEDELQQVNLDLPTTASTLIAVARRLLPFRAFFAGLSDFKIECLDQLEPVGLALAVAHADYRAAVSPPDATTALVDKGTTLRATFELWGKAFADSGLINAAMPEALHPGTSYRDLAIALVGWVRVFRGSDWSKLKAASVLTDDLMTEAEAISQRILAVVGYRELNPDRISAAADVRTRMFTLALKHYDEVERGVTYMRWRFGDAGEFAPSLYAKGARKAAQTTPAAPPASAPTTPAAGTTAPAVVAHAAASAPAASAPAASASVGMPDSSPFTRE